MKPREATKIEKAQIVNCMCLEFEDNREDDEKFIKKADIAIFDRGQEKLAVMIWDDNQPRVFQWFNSDICQEVSIYERVGDI